MPLPIYFRLLVHTDVALKKAPQIFAKHFRGTLDGLGKRLTASAQKRMRKDTGDARQSLRTVIKGRGAGLRMEVYSELVQAMVDAFGRPAGKFPPFRKGTRLYRWTERKLKGFESATVTGSNKRAISSLTRRPSRTKIKGKKRKVRQGKKAGGPVLTSGRLTARERQIEKVSFLVARKIYERGIKASHWNTKALKANKGRIVRDMRDALTRIANELNRG